MNRSSAQTKCFVLKMNLIISLFTPAAFFFEEVSWAEAFFLENRGPITFNAFKIK